MALALTHKTRSGRLDSARGGVGRSKGLTAALVASLALLLASGEIRASDDALSSPSPPPFLGSSADARLLIVPTHDRMPAIKDLAADKCFAIRQIEVAGVELVDMASLRMAVEPLAYRCLGERLAKAIVSAVNDAHAKRGYVTTQAYLDKQNVRVTQRLAITIIKGKVAKVIARERNEDEGFFDAWTKLRRIDGPWSLLSALSAVLATFDNQLDRLQLFRAKGFSDLKTWLATPVTPGDILNVDPLQQGLDQLNRSPSQKATAKLEPGPDPATSNVVIEIPRSDSFRLLAGYEINGLALNGQGTTAQRARIDVAKDNLIGLNDNWSATFASGVNSNEVRTALLVPIRWILLSVNGGYSETLTPLTSFAELFSRKWAGGASASYMLSRDREQQTTLDAGLNWRRFERFVNGVELTPQTIAIARIGVEQVRRVESAQVSYGIGFSKGIGVLDASNDTGVDPLAPRARFWKIDANLAYLHAFRPYGMIRLDAAGQWTNTPLYQDDQLVLGSISTVRGFSSAPVFVDRGAYIRGEVAPNLRIDELFGDRAKELVFAYDALRGLQPYAFIDGGFGHNIAFGADVARVSTGGGVRYSFGRLNLDWTLARPLMRKGLEFGKVSALETYLNLTVKLF